MILTMLRAKIHGAHVTATDLDYEGSIMVDSSLLELSGILPHEKVHVWDRTNGNRFETYAIPGAPESGTVMVNGAAAHLVKPGDKVIIAAFAQVSPEEARTLKPRVVLVDDRNRGKLKA